MVKRGSSMQNYIMIIGLLVISLIVMLNLNKIFNIQASQVESDLAMSILDQITSSIQKIESYPADAKYRIVLEIAEPYNLNVSKSRLSLEFPSRNLKAAKSYFATNINIIETSFSGSGEIYIYKKDKNIYITNEYKDI